MSKADDTPEVHEVRPNTNGTPGVCVVYSKAGEHYRVRLQPAGENAYTMTAWDEISSPEEDAALIRAFQPRRVPPVVRKELAAVVQVPGP